MVQKIFPDRPETSLNFSDFSINIEEIAAKLKKNLNKLFKINKINLFKQNTENELTKTYSGSRKKI